MRSFSCVLMFWGLVGGWAVAQCPNGQCQMMTQPALRYDATFQRDRVAGRVVNPDLTEPRVMVYQTRRRPDGSTYTVKMTIEERDRIRSTAPAATVASAVCNSVIELSNRERLTQNMVAVAADPDLMAAAQRHADWMANNQSLQHGRALVRENIGMGQRTAAEIVRDWMASPGHRANLLSGDSSRMGVGVARAKDGQLYWCQQLR